MCKHVSIHVWLCECTCCYTRMFGQAELHKHQWMRHWTEETWTAQNVWLVDSRLNLYIWNLDQHIVFFKDCCQDSGKVMMNSAEEDWVAKDSDETTRLPQWNLLNYTLQTFALDALHGLPQAHQEQDGDCQEATPHDHHGETFGVLQVLKTQPGSVAFKMCFKCGLPSVCRKQQSCSDLIGGNNQLWCLILAYIQTVFMEQIGREFISGETRCVSALWWLRNN